ncbi:MAG: threonine--tRNA ligase [Nanoarchaeota archaeon]|nr:MAG: threonine--tRNA ligase [Nanoarchaeota archaeon]
MTSITLPNGQTLKVAKGSTALEAAQQIGRHLAQDAIAAKFDNQPVDLSTPIEKDCNFSILTWDSIEGKEVMRHSAAHLLAQAVTRLHPEVKLTIGPTVEDGFYYDMDSPKPFTPDDLPKIEAEMSKIVQENLQIKRHELSKSQAKELFKNNQYKLELIDEADDPVSVYEQGEFKDLCRGPHVISTGKLKAFKLTKISGAYWRADARNRQLQRIYGVVFPEKKMLDSYLFTLQEAEKRDHRKLGKELDLFQIHEEGPGFIFWHPKGTIIVNEIKDFIRDENLRRGFSEIQTPMILNENLWKMSGHYDNFRDNMYFVDIDGQRYAVKPMNCPGACLTYKTKKRSYRELPLRLSEFGHVHRHELAGVISGLVRVRAFTQDDSHSYCTPEGLNQEILEIIDYCREVYHVFGFSEYEIFVATRPEKSVGTEEQWARGTSALKSALESREMKYGIKEGEGAFYGPKIEFNIKDSLGRNWQIGTIQVDFSMPDRFDLKYIGSDGSDGHRPVMVHKAVVGSLERFIGILIEHYAGKFPLWVSPEQVRVLTVSDRFIDFAKKVNNLLIKEKIRASVDERHESLPYKVRDAQLSKVNYILVVGEKEIADETVTVRTRENKVIGAMKIPDFIEKVKKEIASKDLHA